MSSYSQPLNTISYSENSLLPNQRYKPKYINDSDQDKLNSTIDYQSNKLPLNLFHSAAQYNKMLITYGKNRKKNASQITDGVITSLEYVNDRIFEKEIEVRAKAKESIHQSAKQPKKSIDKCTCCCCHQFCQQCANKQRKCSKLEATEICKAKQTIDNQIQLVRKGRKVSLNNSMKGKKHNHNKNSRKENSQRRAHSSIDVHRHNRLNQNHQSYLKQSKKSQNKDISHLVIKSLIQFNKKKKEQEFMRISKLSTQKAKLQYLNTLNQSIRQHNLNQSRLSKSRPKQRDLSKNQIANQYWEQVKQKVLQALKNDNYSKTLKDKLLKYDLNVYDHKELPQRKPKITKQQIQIFRRQHELQAKQQIDRQIQQKMQKKRTIDHNLKSLEKDRMQRIRSCQKKPFQPTAQMIQNAFQNIVQPNSNQIIQKEKSKNNRNDRVKRNNMGNKKGKQIFKNQAIKKSSKK